MMKMTKCNPTTEEVDKYLTFWQSRANKIAQMMGWKGCIGFDPDFLFLREDETTVSLTLDVVDKLISLDDIRPT